MGRIKLFLLDTNIEINAPQDRLITNTLYGGDREMRIRQEIMLGIGGLRALMSMNIEPTVCHMNEGHAAFMALERILQMRFDHCLMEMPILLQQSRWGLLGLSGKLFAGLG